MTSPEYARFYFSFFEDADSARQGLDVAALARLVGAERAEAQDALIQGLPDARCVIGLGVLRAEKAAPALWALFEAEKQMLQESRKGASDDWQPYALIHLAKALSRIRPDRMWSDAIVDVLTRRRMHCSARALLKHFAISTSRS